jgi:hypothetical protein
VRRNICGKFHDKVSYNVVFRHRIVNIAGTEKQLQTLNLKNSEESIVMSLPILFFYKNVWTPFKTAYMVGGSGIKEKERKGASKIYCKHLCK